MSDSTTLRLGLAVGMALLLGALGCEPPGAERPEERRAVTSKLLAPKPLIVVQASDATKLSSGVAEWRLFRGRGGVYLTGHDATGHVVNGLSSEFSRDEQGDIKDALVRVDESGKTRTGAGGKNATPRDAEASRIFVHNAAFDLLKLRTMIRHRIGREGRVDPRLVCGQHLADAVVAPLLALGTSGLARTLHLQALQGSADLSGATCFGSALEQRRVIDAPLETLREQLGACEVGSACAAKVAALDADHRSGPTDATPLAFDPDGRVSAPSAASGSSLRSSLALLGDLDEEQVAPTPMRVASQCGSLCTAIDKPMDARIVDRFPSTPPARPDPDLDAKFVEATQSAFHPPPAEQDVLADRIEDEIARANHTPTTADRIEDEIDRANHTTPASGVYPDVTALPSGESGDPAVTPTPSSRAGSGEPDPDGQG